MEGTVTAMNVSLSQLSTLFKDFVKNFASNGTSGVLGGGPTHVVMAPIGTTISTDHVGTPHTREGAMFKHVKPPVFKGEDKEQNKDAIVTFLHKWQALHQLRCTPDVDTIIQTSLSLEGRAYKW